MNSVNLMIQIINKAVILRQQFDCTTTSNDYNIQTCYYGWLVASIWVSNLRIIVNNSATYVQGIFIAIKLENGIPRAEFVGSSIVFRAKKIFLINI